MALATFGNVIRGNQMEILTVADGHELRFRQLCQQQGKCSHFIIFDSLKARY